MTQKFFPSRLYAIFCYSAQGNTEEESYAGWATVVIGEIAKAKIAAGEKNAIRAVEHLKVAGKRTMDFAKDIGKDLVAEVIKTAIRIS